MPERVVGLLTKLNVGFKKLRLYPPEHTMCVTAIDAAMEALKAATAEERPLTIGLSGTTAVHKGQPLVDLGTKAHALLEALAAGRVQWIRIDGAAERSDVIAFLLSAAKMVDEGPPPLAVAEPTGPIILGYSETTGDAHRGFLSRAGSVLRSMVLAFRAGDSAVPMSELRETIATMSDEVMKGAPPLGILELAMGQREYMIRRAVLTSALAMGLGRRMGLPHAMVQQMGLAGLLADVALFRADEDSLIHRSGGPHQIPRWSEHPSDGARILAAAGAPSLVVVAAAEHHWGLKYASPARHPASSLIGLADAVVGKLLGGFGSPSHRLDLALIGLASEGTHYPVELVRTLLDVSGLFAKGARVRLSNRHRGEIVTPNPLDPLKPEVLMDGETEGMKLVDLASPGERLTLAAVLEE